MVENINDFFIFIESFNLKSSYIENGRNIEKKNKIKVICGIYSNLYIYIYSIYSN